MRRYGKNTNRTVVPGKDAGLGLTLQPLAEACAEVATCEPEIAGLFWFSDSTGLHDQDVEAAYLLSEGAAGPVLGVAKLVGEPCDLPVAWTTAWTPASGTGGDPGYFEDGARLVVYPLADTAPGALEVTAEHDGIEYGPILLTVLRYSCYCYGSSSPVLAWFDAAKAFAGATPSGINWVVGSKLIEPQFAVSSVALTLNSGYALPEGATFRVHFYLAPVGSYEVPPVWTVFFSINNGENTYNFSRTGTATIEFSVANDVPSLRLYFPVREWNTANISIYFEMLGPDGEQWTPAGGE